METGPRLKVSFERTEKRGMDLAIPELVVYRVIHSQKEITSHTD